MFFSLLISFLDFIQSFITYYTWAGLRRDSKFFETLGQIVFRAYSSYVAHSTCFTKSLCEYNIHLPFFWRTITKGNCRPIIVLSRRLPSNWGSANQRWDYKMVMWHLKVANLTSSPTASKAKRFSCMLGCLSIYRENAPYLSTHKCIVDTSLYEVINDCEIENSSSMVQYCYMTTVLQLFNITLILRHFVLLQILCPPVRIDQSYSRLPNGHMTTASISLKVKGFQVSQNIIKIQTITLPFPPLEKIQIFKNF